MKYKAMLSVLMLAVTAGITAQNPIISTVFTPDPAPFVHQDRVYLFADHDEDGPNRDFNMKDWLLFSTDDMVNWTYLGTQVTTATFKWARQGQRAWASQGVERNGKWYWYVCCNIAGGGDALAVAVADSPTGPWTDAIGGPLAEGFGFIDPTVFIDDDGKAYLFWGNKGLWYGRLNDDMVSFADGYREVPGYHDPACFGELQSKMNWAKGRNEMMTQYEEGPWVTKHDGTYYLTYPAGGVPEYMGYSTAPTINGPWTFRGRIMDEAENSFTIHGGQIDFKGRSFMFYHNGGLPGGGGYNRSACVEEFKYNEDGSIPFIPFTKEGVIKPVKNLDPYSRVEGETQAQSSGLKVDRRAGTDHFVTDIDDGDWIRLRSVDFKDCGQKCVVVVVGAQKGRGTIEFYTDSMDGEPFCTVPVNTDNAGFPTAAFTYQISSDIRGVHDLYLVFRCETPAPFELDWWKFGDHANMPLVQTRFTADPAPVVIDGQVYLYTTHDEDGARGFEMFDWLLYTSEDMVNWTDHGAVASLDDFKYYDGKNGAWAEQVVQANGAYYMYCPIHGHGIGVLEADSPMGPWRDPLGEPLVWQKEHWNDIDPTVLVDDDGQAYMYWGNPELYSVKLGKDMISLDGPIVKHPKIQDYQEGPWIWKHDGHYYLAFASTCCPEGIGYAMSDSPEGPWEYKGHIMDHTVRTRGNHPGIIEYKGKSYVFGLDYDVMHLKTFAHAEQRSVSAAEMHYNEDGTIQEVPYFIDAQLEQVKPFNPFRKVQAETMAWGYGLKTKRTGFEDRGQIDYDFTDMYVTDVDPGEYIMLRGVDFGSQGARRIEMSIGSDLYGCVEVHLDSLEGPAVGVIPVNPTGDMLKFGMFRARLSRKVTGVHDLYFKFTGSGHNLFTIDWWRFK